MASREYFSLIPHPPRVEFRWLEKLNAFRGAQLTMSQMSHLQKVIERFQLPCQIAFEAGSTLLRIYPRNVERNPSHARPIPLLTIRDHQVPRGHLPHPRHGTLGKYQLIGLAINASNQTRCETAGISPGSLRPGFLH